MFVKLRILFMSLGEKGQDAVEYALLASLIAVVVIGGVALTGTRLQAAFVAIATTLP